jgi:hypothetical protein
MSNELTAEAVEKLKSLHEGLTPIVAEEKNEDLRNLLGYLVSLMPQQIAILESEDAVEPEKVTALALAVLGR